MQSRLSAAHVHCEAAVAPGDLDAAWHAAHALLETDPASLSAGYVHPFAWAIARVVAAAREHPDGSVTDGAADALRTVVDRFSWWPTHDAWLPVIQEELDGSVEARRAALEVASDARLPVVVAPQARMDLGRALLSTGDRVAAREELRSAIEAARAGAPSPSRA